MSLRARLLIALAAVVLLALLVADVTVYTSIRSFLYQQADSRLEMSHMSVERAAGGGTNQVPPPLPQPGEAGEPSAGSEFCAVGRESAPGMFIEVRGPKGGLVQGQECPAFQPGSTTYTPSLPNRFAGFSTQTSDPGEPTVYFTVSSVESGGPPFRVRASLLSDGRVLVLAETIGNIDNTLERLLLVELAVTLSALLLGLVIGRYLVRIGLRPLRDVERTAEAITAGDLELRVPGADERTEVGHVASALNVMLERIHGTVVDLQSSENRLRRFVSDASHELRTPIAAISAYAQLFRQGAASRQDDLERVMDGVERESARMARLVEELLTLARYDEHHLSHPEPVEVVGLVVEAIETARLVGPDWPITFSASDPVEVLGDRSALRQVIDNLLANVRAHTPAGTRADVRVLVDGAFVRVEVADNGPGLDQADAANVFERFFRTDASRSRTTGGTGLGLAIVATIVHAHDGEVRVSSRDGAVFVVSLPIFNATP